MVAEERERRSTAGKRMNFLTGQALEDDEAFWGHDTWESDNESFHSSDEEEAPDLFDSDFNETEESSDEEEAADAEKEIADEERKARKRKVGYSDSGVIGKPHGGSKKFKPGTKRIVGDEHNAGIVLNVPGAPAAGMTPTGGIARPKKAPVVVFPTASFTPALASTRQRRSAREASGYSNEAREAATAAAEEAQRKQPATTVKPAAKPKHQQVFPQADLLLEAVNETEPSNERWLLGRKRIQAEKELSTRDDGTNTNSTYTEKFISRKGYLNTINFADMDHIPNVLIQKNKMSTPPKVPLCAVTGKPARYRDPKSGYGYYDLEAFRIVRAKWEEEQAKRRHEESLVEGKSRKAKNGNGKSTTSGNHDKHSTHANGKTLQQSLHEKNPTASESSTGGAPTAKPRKRPGRPKGKKSKMKSPATIDTSSSIGTSTAATASAPSATSVPLDVSSELPKDDLQLHRSSDGSNRKSPRRRKPTARMQESIDEGLLPSSPKSPSSEQPPPPKSVSDA